MGGSGSRGFSPLGECAPQGPGTVVAKGGSAAVVVSVVRTAAWGLGSEEDVWQVEVPKDATAAQLKVKIEELYEVPAAMQKLAASAVEDAATIEDGTKVESLANKRIYLQPCPEAGAGPMPEDQEALQEMMGTLVGAAQEQMEMGMALEESLKGVTYLVHFERPRDVGGSAAGKKVTLTLDALAMVGDVQQIVELELFGSAGAEPAFLLLDGVLLPPHLPLHMVGVDESGKTVVVAKEQPPPSAEEQQLAAMLSAAVGMPGSGVVPGGN